MKINVRMNANIFTMFLSLSIPALGHAASSPSAEMLVSQVAALLDQTCESLTEKNGDCTFSATLYRPTTAQWNQLRASGALNALTTPAEIEQSFARCLFSQFAYTSYTAEEERELARRYSKALERFENQPSLYEARFNSRHLAPFSAHSTVLLHSAGVGGPDCQIIVKPTDSDIFATMSSDVQD